MRPQSIAVSSQAASNPVPLDWKRTPFAIGFCVELSGGATLTYTVQHTFDDINNGETAVWFDHSSVTGKTANADGNYAFPVTAIRLNVTAYTSGTATLKALQGGSLS